VNRICIAVLVLALAAATGCGRHSARLTGRVSIDGKLLTTGVVTLTPVGPGSSAYAAIGPDGRYTIHTGAATGLEPGEYVVTVAANAGSGGVEAPGNKGLSPLITPPKYADVRRSPLRARVERGSQEIDFELPAK